MRRLDQFTHLVVVIDESLVMRTWMRVVLGREGVGVKSYEDPFEALRDLAALDAEIPALAFIEMDFPHAHIKSGLAVLRVLRSKAELQGVPVVMISKRDRVIDRVFARVAGANDYLVKPLTTQAVVTAFWTHAWRI